MSVANIFPGELENLGKGVSYCATCDGALYRGKAAIIIRYSKEDEKEADFLAEIAEEVIYLPMYQEVSTLNNKIRIIPDAKPLSIEKNEGKVILKMESESIKTDGIFILRDSVVPSQLVPGLEIDKNQVVVDRSFRTNIAGLFACGDIIGAPYQYIKVAGEGNVAALSAVSYLAEKKTRESRYAGRFPA